MTKHTQDFINRVQEIVILLLDKQPLLEESKSNDLLAIIMERYAVQKRQAVTYLSEARLLINQLGKQNIKLSYLKAMYDREFLFRKSKDANDLRLALEVIRDRDKIAGLYVENYKFEKEPAPDLTNISTEELKALLHE